MKGRLSHSLPKYPSYNKKHFARKKHFGFLNIMQIEEKKSPNDHYLILQLKLFNKIAQAELGAEGQR